VTQALAIKKTCPQCGGTFDTDAVFCPRDGTKLSPEGDPTDPSADPYIGTVIAGDIEIRSIAGRGAMGRVYRAHQRGIDRNVAVKILHRELSGNPQLVSRFHREAKIASKLSHPHVVEVFMAGQLPDGALYIVMEFLDGSSLAQALDDAGGSFDVARALSIALQISDAVGEGHARGIVHRDLKPENVMLVRRAEMGDWVKVLDFGIAKVSLGEQSMETQAGLIFGTARYISPEGAQGITVGPAGDVYSLATIVYQTLAGRTPFDAEQPVGLLIKHIHEAPLDLRSNPRSLSVPEPIARVVMENLSKDPEKRSPNARAFGNALASAAKAAHVVLADVGAVARLSMLDVAARPTALEPTLDDAVGMQAPRPPVQVSVSPVQPMPPPRELEQAATSQVPSGPREPTPLPVEKRRFPWLVVVLTFALGAALAALISQFAVNRADVTRRSHITRTRKALADSHYVSPPGNNVRELVADGLKQWPDDITLLQIRSDAAHELVTRSMAAHSGGDVDGARDLAKNAIALDATDRSARLLVDQYEDESKSLTSEPGASTGNPRIFFTVPASAKPGEAFEVHGRIMTRSSGPHAKITGAKLTVFDNNRNEGGRPTSLTEGAKFTYTARMQAPATGSYDVVFEANVDGRLIRAERDLDVIP
jgi:serine/threonine-protein kinase